MCEDGGEVWPLFSGAPLLQKSDTLMIGGGRMIFRSLGAVFGVVGSCFLPYHLYIPATLL